MSVTIISLLINVVLAITLAFVILKAKARIIEEKLATFAGVSKASRRVVAEVII